MPEESVEKGDHSSTLSLDEESDIVSMSMSMAMDIATLDAKVGARLCSSREEDETSGAEEAQHEHGAQKKKVDYRGLAAGGTDLDVQSSEKKQGSIDVMHTSVLDPIDAKAKQMTADKAAREKQSTPAPSSNAVVGISDISSADDVETLTPPPISRNTTMRPPQEPGAYAVRTVRPGHPMEQLEEEGDPTAPQQQQLRVAEPSITDNTNETLNEGAPLDAALVDSAHERNLDVLLAEENGGAAGATAATSSPNQDATLVRAQIMPEQSDHETNHTGSKNLVSWGLVLAALLVVALCIFVAVSLTTSSSSSIKDNKDSSSLQVTEPPESATGSDEQPTTQPSVIWYPPFQDKLPVATRNAIENDPTSDQYRANAWMWNDPYLDTYSPDRQMQRFSLVAFFYGTRGDEWRHNDHWLSYEVSECEWFSQSNEPICDEHDNLVKVDLHHNNLRGTIPIESQFIPHLEYSDLSYNEIEGGTPNFVSNDKLLVIKISHNRFAGPLVAEAGFSAFNMKVLEMDGNGFYGYVAPIYQFLPHLERINLTSNAFSGTLPQELQYATNLKYVGLGHNRYHGTVPSSLGVLTGLEGLDLSGLPDVHGTLPSEVGNMVALRELDITGTNITGVIPEQVCDLITMQTARTGTDLAGLELNADCHTGDLQCCS